MWEMGKGSVLMGGRSSLGKVQEAASGPECWGGW